MSSLQRFEPPELGAERTLAAYLGFDNIFQLQRFLISWPCIETWSLITRFVTNNGEEIFPIFRHSDFQDRETQSEIVFFLRAMARDIEVYANRPDEYNLARTARAMARIPPGAWIPEFPPQEVAVGPILSPVQSYQEGEMIPLHRCLVILQYFDVTHGSVERRVDYLLARERLSLSSFEVGVADVPWWMPPRV
ncbi:unnamed protein product [Penicillium bialowiezense]